MPSSDKPSRVLPPQPPTPIGYVLPRKKVDPPSGADVAALIGSIIVGFVLVVVGVLGFVGAVQNGGSFDFRWTLACIILGVGAIGLGIGSWKNSGLRRRSRANAPRFCEGCGAALTGLAVTRCPDCGSAHPDSAEAAAKRLGEYVDAEQDS